MGVIELPRSSGDLPSHELSLRGDASPPQLRHEIADLLEQGLVSIAGDLREPESMPATQTAVHLATLGLRRAFS